MYTVIKALGLDSCSGTIIGALLVLENVAAAMTVSANWAVKSSASFSGMRVGLQLAAGAACRWCSLPSERTHTLCCL